MNIIGHIDPSAFAARPRMHHCEPTAQFPSSVSSRRRGLLALKACNWRAARGGGWTNPYVTDGLVAMWDGEWNVGGGEHDNSAMSWIEIVTGTACQYSKDEVPNWGEKCWRSVAVNDAKFFDAFWPDGIASDHTIEVVALKNTAARGTILGAYGLASSNGCSVEWFVGQKLRVYYAGNPDLLGVDNSFLINKKVYSCIRRSGLSYQILNGSATAIATVSSSANNLNASPARIGTDSRTSSMCLNGDIYCIRVYDRALSAEEIAANYAVDKARFNLP